MVFSNDLSRINEAQKTSLRRILIIVVPSFLWAMFTIAIVLKDYEKFVFIILTTFLGGIFSVFFGLYLGRRSNRKEYQEYRIRVEDNSIAISSTIYNQIIRKGEIKKITINNQGILTIFIKNKHIIVSKYLENIEEFKKVLNGIKPINEVNHSINYLEYISILFFCGLFLIRFIPDYRLYLIVASGFVITTIISTIKLFLGPIKKSKILITLLINIFLIIIVSKNVIDLVIRILNR